MIDNQSNDSVASSADQQAQNDAWRRIAAHQGAAAGRNAWALHTTAEVEALIHHLHLRPGAAVLDLGCGDGRHLGELARQDIGGLGIDLAEESIRIAKQRTLEFDEVDFLCADAREFLDADPIGPAPFDAAISVNQGVFSSDREIDALVLRGIRRHVRTGGRAMVAAYHAGFALAQADPDPSVTIDLRTMTMTHVAEVLSPNGVLRETLQTTLWTPTELEAAARTAGLIVEDIVGGAPGRWTGEPITTTTPELLLLSRIG